MKRFTTATATVFLLVPCFLFLVIVKNIEKNGKGEITTLISSRSSVNEIAQFVTPSRLCNCDTKNKRSEVSGNAATTEPQFEDISDNEVDTANDDPRPTIYVITPTYTRPTQMADMTRLAQTLMLVKNIFWIVCEDANKFNPQVTELLNRTEIPSVQLLGPRPATHRDKRSGRGVSNRLRALKWIRDNLSNDHEGVIYFADDDNTYDIRIFEEMRYTGKVSVWPVGLFTKLGMSTPILNKSGKVVAFYDPFLHRRKFAVDMAGFAVNLRLFLSKPRATMPYKVGYEEDYFIKSLGVTLSDLEPKADNCTKVYVWHTKTQQSVFPNIAKISKQKLIVESNIPSLYNNVMNGVYLN